ncbi:mechanosensitive ion channel family protein [Stygiobacter electus]|uniref:Mechanosensitive ion channel n=1 Tax=Stygiobacter electus TaxID=3032292 RepID=A0AAE3P278_9BACT|nr:mechanosensitive ion channel domain-containing protein [Stygiobacter electus]MDF1611708.1 mechanosensitive ion channel [Stygiobacter electus]
MFKNIIHWFRSLNWVNDTFVFLAIVFITIISYFFLKDILFRIIKRIVKRTKTIVDDILFSKTFLRRISYLAPLLILSQVTYLVPEYEKFFDKLLSILLVFVFFISIGALLTSFSELSNKIEKLKERPIKSYIQIVKIILYSFMAMMILGIIVGQSIWSIVTGLGAFTAILILVFKDTILNFIASLQISSYDLVRVGDWIEVPKFGADGDVIDISLMIVKVQNFDKTITIIPTYKLIEETFKNWRGMTQSGVRRIKRSIFIDQRTIKFCSDELINKFLHIKRIKNFVEERKAFVSDDFFKGITNIALFREYVKEYLTQKNEISNDFSFQVRQLPSTPEGLPIEIYAYATKTNFVEYEDLQAEIINHVLAILNQFELEIFQNPSGNDFKQIIK